MLCVSNALCTHSQMRGQIPQTLIKQRAKGSRTSSVRSRIRGFWSPGPLAPQLSFSNEDAVIQVLYLLPTVARECVIRQSPDPSRTQAVTFCHDSMGFFSQGKLLMREPPGELFGFLEAYSTDAIREVLSKQPSYFYV